MFPAAELKRREEDGDAPGGFQGKSSIAGLLNVPSNVRQVLGRAYKTCVDSVELREEDRREFINTINTWSERRGLEKIYVRNIRTDTKQRRELQSRVVISVQKRCRRQNMSEKTTRKLIRVASKTLSTVSKEWALLMAQADEQYVKLYVRGAKPLPKQKHTPSSSRSVFSLPDCFNDASELDETEALMQQMQRASSLRNLLSNPCLGEVKPIKKSNLKRTESAKDLKSDDKKRSSKLKTGVSARSMMTLPSCIPDEMRERVQHNKATKQFVRTSPAGYFADAESRQEKSRSRRTNRYFGSTNSSVGSLPTNGDEERE